MHTKVRATSISGKKDTRQYMWGDLRAGAKKPCQDCFLIWESPDDLQSVTFGGVFDGHGGALGLLAAQTARDYMQKILENNWQTFITSEWSKKRSWVTLMTDTFAEINELIREEFLNTPPRYSLDRQGIVRNKNTGQLRDAGTTATCVFLLKQPSGSTIIISANVGDSVSLLLTNKCRTYLHLTTSHSPDSEEEFLRIRDLPDSQYKNKLLMIYEQNAEKLRHRCPRIFLADGTKDPKYLKKPWDQGLRPSNLRHTPACYATTPEEVKHESVNIGVTRALGDFHVHQYGLSAEPSIEREIIPEKVLAIIVVASDGIWDCWGWQDFSDFMAKQLKYKAGNLKLMVNATLKESLKLAKKNFGPNFCDDMACVLLKA